MEYGRNIKTLTEKADTGVSFQDKDRTRVGGEQGCGGIDQACSQAAGRDAQLKNGFFCLPFLFETKDQSVNDLNLMFVNFEFLPPPPFQFQVGGDCGRTTS